MPSTALGIDIGSHQVTAAEVRSVRGRLTVTNFGGVELPHGAVHEGEIVDPEATADAIAALLSSTGIRTRRAHLGVSNQRVVVREIDLPWVDEAELRASLRYQVQEFIPIPVAEAELDVHVVEEHETDEGTRLRRVMLVAAQRETIASMMDTAARAGLRAVGIDLNPFAALRVIANPMAVAAELEVLVDIGAGVTNIVVHRAGVPTFVRILVMGGEDITQALAEALDIDREEAERVKRVASVGYGRDEADRIVTAEVDRFVREIRSSLTFFQAQSTDSQVRAVTVTGGGAQLTGLVDRLADALQLPVEIDHPFRRLRAKRTVFGEDALAAIGPSLTTAVGLAMGGLE